MDTKNNEERDIQYNTKNFNNFSQTDFSTDFLSLFKLYRDQAIFRNSLI